MFVQRTHFEIAQMNQPAQPKKKVVLLASDLMLGSNVSGAASFLELEYRCVGTAQDAVDQCADQDCQLLVDLGTPELDVQALAAGLPAECLAKAIAYGPHVHVAKLEEAGKAGFGRVMSRGQFSAQVGPLLQAFKTDS